MDQSNIQLADRQLIDAGFAMLPNYWLRFWRPALAHTYSITVAILWEQLLAYTRPPDDECHPSISTLAAALGVDRRHLIGRTRPGHDPEPGAIAILQLLRLIRAERDPAGDSWSFVVRRDPGLLPEALVAALPSPTQHAHAAWLERWNTNICSMAYATPTNDQNKRSMACATGGVACATGGVACATRTDTLTLPTQHREGEEQVEHAFRTEKLTILQPTSSALAIVWRAALDTERPNISAVDWESTRSARLVEIRDDCATVYVSNSHALRRLHHINVRLSDSLSRILSRPITIIYETERRSP